MTLTLIAIIFLLASFLLLVMTIRCCRRAQWFRGTFNGSLALSTILLSIVLLLITSNLYSYQRLTHEQHIADVYIKNNAVQQYQVTLKTPQQETRQFEISGDDWQIDARVLKWHPYANLLGLDLQYQLERISGRFIDINQEKSKPRNVYALSTYHRIDIWQLARRYPAWLPFVDAVYGSAAYVPLSDGATYEVFATQSGLIIRAANHSANKTVTSWH